MAFADRTTPAREREPPEEQPHERFFCERYQRPFRTRRWHDNAFGRWALCPYHDALGREPDHPDYDEDHPEQHLYEHVGGEDG